MYGLKHNLTLVRKTDDDTIFKAATAGAEKVSLDKISLFMPRVIPADAEKFSIYKHIESKVKVSAAHITRQCDMLSVSESTSHIATERKDSSEVSEIYYCWFPNG